MLLCAALSCWLVTAACHRAVDLPDFGGVPDFTLTERSGRPVSKQDLLGKAWIVDFIFTNCPGPCPRLSAQMKQLQTDLPDKVHLLSVSVDPERDTPEALRKYATRFGASDTRWWFLTGPRENIVALTQDGFRLPIMSSEGGDEILHTTRFVLIDPRGSVRGYYDGEDPEAMNELRRDARALAPESFLGIW
ncbi:MAG: SCO family protein [Nitrospirae bacterium]|nr:SCO family protein [Nitrospirota bacterium]